MIDLADTRFDLLVIEELHDVIGCNWGESEYGDTDNGREPCSRTAHWVLKCPGCPQLDLYCTPHRVMDDEWAKTARDVHCMDCDTKYPVPFQWQPL